MNMEIQAALDVADETDSFLQITDVIYEKVASNGYQALNDSEKTVYCIDQLLREMENGGLVQFIHHESGAYAVDTLDALSRIRAQVSHDLMQQLINFFPDSLVPADEDDRIDIFDRIEAECTDEIAALDDEYYESGENLVELTLKYVQKNLKSF